MKVTVSYSETQIDKAVEFLAKNNIHFLQQEEYIRSSIRNHMQEMILAFPDSLYLGTMGYYLLGFIEEIEGLDEDRNYLRIEVLVDPSVALEHNYKTEDFVLQKT